MAKHTSGLANLIWWIWLAVKDRQKLEQWYFFKNFFIGTYVSKLYIFTVADTTYNVFLSIGYSLKYEKLFNRCISVMHIRCFETVITHNIYSILEENIIISCCV